MPRKTILFIAFGWAILALILAGPSDGPVIAGTAPPNVAGTWEGSWRHRVGSGRITLRLAQGAPKSPGSKVWSTSYPYSRPNNRTASGRTFKTGTWRTPR